MYMFNSMPLNNGINNKFLIFNIFIPKKVIRYSYNFKKHKFTKGNILY